MQIEPKIRKTYVPSGQYKVSGKKPEILEAILGTCVAVTLCDRHADVGGMMHILLAAPFDRDNVWGPLKYAETGLPLFIEALCEAGAEKERLEAHIAGGALIGPLSTMDLELDVGGQTVDVVLKILKKEKIDILKAETGGYFPCRFNLDIRSWECGIEPLYVPESAFADWNFKRPTIEEIEESIKRVRPVPQIVLKIIRMIRDANVSLRNISEELRKDQVLSAKVIRLANSVFWGIEREIDAIDRALVFLGEKQFLQLIISSSLKNFFPVSENGYSLCKGGIYRHALGTALVSEALADFSGAVPSDIAYTAGLLHDIGKVVLDQKMAAMYPLFYRRTQEDGIDMTVVEREEFGIDHTETGARLARNWSLPDNLIEAIRCHHDPEKATIDPKLSHVVYLADLITSKFLAGQELERVNDHKLGIRLQAVGIKPEAFPRLIDSIPDRIFQDSFLLF
ncbi:MAG: HDOD domain-containing protein [Deltaproteobacteria bacterium]|nr:HDOD domain-containing protein [Deltaproteobacteria bacterium]